MMYLYSGITCPFSHRCRIVLFEKDMDFEIKYVDIFNKPENLHLMNPYNQVPVLQDRDLALYESNVINEYLDERFPHPQLMPGDPNMRARARLFLFYMEKEIFKHVQVLENMEASKKEHDLARNAIKEELIRIAPTFDKKKFVHNDTFSMIDVAIAPLLWRLDHYGIDLASSVAAMPLLKYGERLFTRDAFIKALTPSEKAMRK